MADRRGRPTGYELSDKSKKKISKSRFGQTQAPETKNKISTSLMEYFNTEMGIAQRKRCSEVNIEFWNSYSGKLARNIMKSGLKRYWEKRKKAEKEFGV